MAIMASPTMPQAWRGDMMPITRSWPPAVVATTDTVSDSLVTPRWSGSVQSAAVATATVLGFVAGYLLS